MTDEIYKLPDCIKNLVNAQNQVKEHYNKELKSCNQKNKELKFTLDGRLVGDIGESLAALYFNVVLAKEIPKGVDGYVKDDMKNDIKDCETVQVKATGRENGTADFRELQSKPRDADFILFFQIDWEECTWKVIYNCEGGEVYKLLDNSDRDGIELKIDRMREINECAIKNGGKKLEIVNDPPKV